MTLKTGRYSGKNGIKRLVSAAAVVAALGIVAMLGGGELAADGVAQNSWRVILAEAADDGIRVETAGENLALHSGVKVLADSEESREFSAARVRDGISDEETLRWSSANDWENNEHWLQISFPQEVTVGLVRIYWERTNASAYALEYSDDGKNWQTAIRFEERPQETQQDILLEEAVTARYLRLHVTEVAKEEADLSLYYQNVSVLELEVYEGIEDSFLIEKPEIPAQSRRKLVSGEEADTSFCAVPYPTVPQGYALEFVGADYEMLVEADGRIADNLSDVEAELGFALVKDGIRYELPGMAVTVPAAEGGLNAHGEASDASKEVTDVGEEVSDAQEALPEGYTVMEWAGGSGIFTLSETVRIVIEKEQEEALLPTAQLFAEELSEALGRSVEVAVLESPGTEIQGTEIQDTEIKGESMRTDIVLRLNTEQEDASETSWISGLGEEGYEIHLGEDWAEGADRAEGAGRVEDAETGVQIVATTAQGMRWGCVSFLTLLEKSEGSLPEGRIRDYPRYSVRGFGIDVGRRAVSLELLYRIVEEMSKQKMNTLQIHLNDNQIIAQSDYDGTLEGARSLYAGFRLESDLKNEDGEGITSTDLFYTKEEFAQFIADAAVYGVEVVPEIDTPAHSLAITKIFPQLGLSSDPEGADQLDLSNPEAIELVKGLWSEYLIGEEDTAVFAGCDTVHLGMDEYFGDEGEYIAYLEELSDYIRTIAPDVHIRVWGSLSKIEADHSGVSKGLEMQIWDVDWADPQDMYDEGFSIINSLSSSLYIIPGGGYDWLDQEFLEEDWQPNVFETSEGIWELPAYSERMMGAVYMMWNDWSQQNGEEITEEGLFERFAAPLPLIAGKLWGNYGK